MATYQIQAPDGSILKIEGPDGATDEQLIAVAKRDFESKKLLAPPKESAFDPSAGELQYRPFGINTGIDMPEGASRYMAGVGSGMNNVASGVGQFARDAISGKGPMNILRIPGGGGLAALAKFGNYVTDGKLADKLGLTNTEDVDYARSLNKPLLSTMPGKVGDLTGNIAASIPLAMIPGANTVAGGAAVGALSGAMSPVGANDSRALNTAVGGTIGAVLPAAINTVKGAKAALVDPFTESGITKIAGGLLNRQASNPREAALRLRSATANTPGFNLTTGQAAGEDGIAALERTLKASRPNEFSGLDQSQRSALADALRSIAKNAEERDLAVSARKATTEPLYAAAGKEQLPINKELSELLKRPSMQSASGKAIELAAEKGRKIAIPSDGQTVSNILDANGNPIVINSIPTIGGDVAHTLKMGLDMAIGSPGIGGMQGAQRSAALDTKEAYVNWLRQNSGKYGEALTKYAELSKPINQMDVGQALYEKFVPALSDQGGDVFRTTANSYATALRNGDVLARNATGLKSATLEGVMTPEQMKTLSGVAKDAATKAAAETAGRGVGSDTVQKLALSNIASQAGLPRGLANGLTSAPIGWIRRLGDLVYGGANDAALTKAAQLMKSPKDAADAMIKAGATSGEVARYLRAVGQSGMMGSQKALFD